MLEKSIGLCFGMRSSCTEALITHLLIFDKDKLLFLTVAPGAPALGAEIFGIVFLQPRFPLVFLEGKSRLISFTILKAFDSERPLVIYWAKPTCVYRL